MSESGNRGRRLRLTVLLGILALALFAWWYDWKVARPSVDAAWDKINALNDSFNAQASSRVMTNADVQETLGRKPARQMPVGNYQVEVYSWMAGLPFRTHDYFAVYTQGSGALLFSTHYKFELPQEDLAIPSEPPADADAGPPPDMPIAAGASDPPPPGAGGEGKGPRGKRSRRGGKSPDAAERDAGEKPGAAEEGGEKKPADEKPAAAEKAAEKSAGEKPDAAKKGADKAESAAKPVEKPAAAEKAAEKSAGEKPDAAKKGDDKAESPAKPDKPADAPPPAPAK